MRNIAGPPVEGENFFGREAEIEIMLETLQDQNVLLLGPRRIGKTSFARAVMRRLQDQGWRVIECNVGKCSSEKDFTGKLIRAIKDVTRSWPGRQWDALRQNVTGFLNRIEAIGGTVPGGGGAKLGLRQGAEKEPLTVALEALRELGKTQERWLLYIDELPIMLYNILGKDGTDGCKASEAVDKVRNFLAWLRYEALGASAAQRWLITGSVGLDTLAQQNKISDMIQGIKHETLQPFSKAEAVAMLQKLAATYSEVGMNEQNAQALVEAVQWPQPYYLQLVFNHLRTLRRSKGLPAAELIEAAIEEALRPGQDNDLHHWRDRLFLQLGRRNGGHASALLYRAARIPEGERPELLFTTLQERMPDDDEDTQRELFSSLRDILIRDAYWWEEERDNVRRYRFRLELLRRWWVRKGRV